MFQAHIAIDPSLWWDDNLLVRKAASTEHLSGAVYISLANSPDVGDGDPKKMEQAGRDFAAALKSAQNIRSELEYFEAEDHGSVPLLGLYHGLLHIFDGYKPPAELLLNGGPEETSAHFESVSERLGVRLSPPEATIELMGYVALYLKEDVDRAIALFKLNVESFPESWTTHNRLAEAYAVNGDRLLAIEHYEISLKLNPDNQSTIKQLETLKSESEEGLPPVE